MNFAQTFRMSIKAIRGKRIRSVLTMLGIVIGVAAVITLISLQTAQNAKNMEWFTKMGSNRIDVYVDTWSATTDISRELENFCATELTDLVVGITPSAQGWWKMIRSGSKSLETPLAFGSEQYGLCSNMQIAKGRDLAYMDIQRNNRVCVLGSYVADKLFNYKNPIGEDILITGQRFTVVGVYESHYNNEQYSQDGYVLLPYTQMRLLFPGTKIGQYIVKAKDADATVEASDRLKTFLKPFFREEWGFGVSSSDEYVGQIEERNRENTLMLVGIAAISLIVGGIGIMNIMLVTVTERTREIGIRKAIGAPRRTIILQFLIEASVLSFIGGLIGVFFGFIASLFLGKMSLDTLVLPNLTITAIALGFSIALGVAFGIYPAAKASKLQPVVALRNE